MKFRGKAIKGTSILLIIGAICCATGLVGAASTMFLSNPTGPTESVVGLPLIATEQASTDLVATSEYNAWTCGYLTVGNTYTDGLNLTQSSGATYSGEYDIMVTVDCESTSQAAQDTVSMQWAPESGSYTNVSWNSFTSGVSGPTPSIWTAIIPVYANMPGEGNSVNYNFLITLSPSAQVGPYSVTYQAVEYSP